MTALSFVKKLLVARYRHNVCVSEVTVKNTAIRHRKLKANAIVHTQPVAKFYDILPPLLIFN